MVNEPREGDHMHVCNHATIYILKKGQPDKYIEHQGNPFFSRIEYHDSCYKTINQEIWDPGRTNTCIFFYGAANMIFDKQL